MNNTLPTKTKIPVKSIQIVRVEGPADLCTTTEHSSWASANERLRSICSTAPNDGKYNKCDFHVLFADGETYDGGFDAAHPHSSKHEPANLAEHMRRYLTFLAGLSCPPHMSQEEYDEVLERRMKVQPDAQESALAFLVKYSLEDAQPVTTDDGRKAQHIGDAAAQVVADAQGFCDPAFLRKLNAVEKGLAALVADLEQASRPPCPFEAKLGAMNMQLRKAMLCILAAKGIK